MNVFRKGRLIEVTDIIYLPAEKTEEAVEILLKAKKKLKKLLT